jgi:hypothetical protein
MGRAGSYIHVATYVKAASGRGGWTVHTVNGSQVAYLGFVAQRGEGDTSLRKMFPRAAVVQDLDVTGDQYGRLENDRLN